MVPSMTKRKAHRHPPTPVILGGVEPCVFWKPAAPSGPGTATGPERQTALMQGVMEGRGGGAEKKGDIFLLQTILSNSKKIT